MAIIVGIFGMSGDGKTTSVVINPDGTYNFTKEGYQGINPSSHFIINLDRKKLPYPAGMWDTSKQNYVETSDLTVIKQSLDFCAKNPKIKSIQLDTLNLYLAHKEFNDRKKLTFDQWRDIA